MDIGAQEASSPAVQTGVAQPVLPVTLSFSEQPQDDELQTSHVFPEMLVPMAGVEQEGENAALAAALLNFAERTDHEDLSMFQAFQAEHPTSRWNAALFLNLGMERYQRGYLTQALQYWENAWNLAKADTDSMRKLVADRALGELLLLNARLGRMDKLNEYFEELSKRQYDGSIGAHVDSAKQGLARMTTQPEIAFKCGPFALNSILNARDKTPFATNSLLEATHSTTQGTNLLQVRGWAAEVGLNYQVARREATGRLIYPAVMHWKADHFAAILAELDGRYLVQDATFGGGEMWITEKAINAETDGYFLVPAGELPPGWQPVSDEEAAQVWGKGGAQGRDENSKTCSAPKGGGSCPGPGMASSSYYLMQASLNLQDVPMYYQPIVGPTIAFAANYNHLETAQTSAPAFSHMGPNWDFNWVSYLDVDSNLTVTLRLRSGGTEVYTFSQFNNITGSYLPDRYSQAVLRWTTSATGGDVYRREFSDGSVEVYSQPMTAIAGQDKRYFLKQVIDPQGNVVTLNYEFVVGTTTDPVYNGLTPGQNLGIGQPTATATGRINEIIDASGAATLIRYVSNDRTYSAAFYRIKQVYGPGHQTTGVRRFIEFSYDGTATVPNQLISIKDVVGMVSQFSYDPAASSAGFINSLTTEYGKTLFHQYSDNGILTRADGPDAGTEPDPVLDANGNTITVPGLMRGLRVTYPNGSVAVVENWLGHEMKTFHWDRNAMKRYPLDPLLDISNPARSEHCELYVWLMDVSKRELSAVPLYTKQPLKDQVNYTYSGQSEVTDPSGQTSHQNVGGTDQPSTVTSNENVDGNSAGIVSSSDYNLQGSLTKYVDPQGRVTYLAYDATGADLLEVRQQNGSSKDLLAKMVYNTRHLPVKIWDAGGHLTEMTYNAQGQVTSVKNALNQIVTLTYVSNLLTSVDGPLDGSADVSTFTYDGYQRLKSATDAEGYKVSYEYDDLNRPTKITYQPQFVTLADAEYEEIVWDRLNPVLFRDRKGRISNREYDEMGMLVAEIDPEGRRTEYEWCTCGSLSKLKDGNGSVTEWFYDDIGRMIRKKRADGREELVEYYPNSDRVRYVTTVGAARREMIYHADGSVKQVRYYRFIPPYPGVYVPYAADPQTPDITFTYDAAHPRMTSASSALGTVSYDYHAYRTSALAALKPGAGQVRRIVDTAVSGEIFYLYDALGRATTRSIDAVINDAIDPVNQTTAYTLDAAGRVKTMTDPLGLFNYDYVDEWKGLARLDKITYPNGLFSQFSWDQAEGHHRLLQIAHRHGAAETHVSTYLYGYGAQGQLKTWQQHVGLETSKYWELEHDDAEQLRSVVIRQDYDSIIAPPQQHYYSYDAGGNRTTWQENNQVRQTAFNSMNQIVARPSSGTVRFQGRISEPGTVSLTRDGVTQSAQMSTFINSNGASEFQFRADLPLADGTNTVTIAAKDGSGNETTPPRQFEVSVSGQQAAGVPLYDTRGNMTSNGRGQTYTWDAQSRLLSIQYADGSLTEFRYDCLGRRSVIREKSPSGAVLEEKRLLWCGLELCQERNSENAVVKHYSAHGWLLLPENRKLYVTRDHLGSVRQVVDEQGKTVVMHDYDAYGVQSTTVVQPPPPEAGLFRWLKADHKVGRTKAGNVTAWQPVNGNFTPGVSPPSTAARPQWQGNGLNGRPIVRFDGVDDALTSTTGMADVSQDFTVFVVHRRQAQTAGGAGVVSFSTDMPRGSQTPAKTSTLSLSWNNAWSTPSQTLTAGIGLAEQSADPWDGKPRVEAAPHQAAWQVSTLVKANTTLLPPAQAWTNGVTFESDVTVRTQANGVIQQQTLQDFVQTYAGEAGSYALGRRTVDGSGVSQGYFRGDIAEVLIYNRALSSEEQTQVEVYLTSRHALPSPTASLDLTSDFRYTGHYYHKKSGLHLAPYRAYDAEMAVWLSEDPIQESGGINLYGYVGGSPLMYVDPLGLDWHHLIPFAAGLDAGLPSDFINGVGNGLDMDGPDHKALHKAGWVKDWNNFFKSNPNASCAEATDQLNRMKTVPKYSALLAKGKAVTTDYPRASQRMANRSKIKGKSAGAGILAGLGFVMASFEAEAAGADYIDSIERGDDLGIIDASNRLGQLNPFGADLTAAALAVKGMEACR